MKRIAALVLSVGLFVTSAHQVQAEGFALYDWGARGSSLANAIVGRADDASAVAHNPAGITQLEGNRLMVGASLFAPKMLIDTRTPEGTTQNRTKRSYFFVPHAFYTHQINDSVWFGFGSFTRFGLGNTYPDGWAGKYNLKDVKLQTLSLNPNFAFKVTDSLSFAIGGELQIARMTMHKYIPADPYGRSSSYTEIKGHNNAAFGFNAALHYKFNEQWSAGLTYRSAITHKVKGDMMSYNNMFGQILQGSANLSTGLKGNLRTPDHISFGVAYKPTDNLSVEVGTVYTVWSKFRNFNIDFTDLRLAGTPLASSQTHKDWKDTWLFNIGVEYLPLDWLALRAGFSYETSPIPGGRADYMVETNGRTRYSCGVGFLLDDWTIDLAYSMLRSNELDYCQAAREAGTTVLPGRSHHGITHVGAVSIGYKF